jgi:alpha-L-arabinofuranosidase
LLLSYTEPKKLIGIAGRDQKTGDLIVKMVNGNDDAIETEIELDGTVETAGTYKAYTIASGETTAENSFTEPKKYIPVTTTSKTVGAKKLVHSFPKYSITVLRIPTKK